VVIGFGWGLLLSWLSIYMFSHIDWLTVRTHASGCSDMEHCNQRSVTLLALAATLFLPAFVFSVLNGVAYQRWSTQKWVIVFALGSLVVVLLYLIIYAIPHLGIAKF
jgi:hypothetical protein